MRYISRKDEFTEHFHRVMKCQLRCVFILCEKKSKSNMLNRKYKQVKLFGLVCIVRGVFGEYEFIVFVKRRLIGI